MTRITVLRTLVLAAMALLVGFSPASHILKHQLSDGPRYDGWKARASVLGKLNAGDRLYFSSDRFMPPFLDLVVDMYRGHAEIKSYWIFPYLVIGRDLEMRTVNDFVCHAWRHEESSIVWGVSKEYLTNFDKESREFDFNLGFWRKFKVKFRYSDILYEVYDGMFVRGQIERIVGPEDDGADGLETLYQRGAVPTNCR